MLDRYNREINYLRISVTDKCNLRCTYCMPAEGIPLKTHNEIMSFEDIVKTAEAAAKVGIRKIRLTGGEPLVRKGIVQLVKMLNNVKGIEHLAMTTNGVLLSTMAAPLRAAGLNSVNISLDTLIPERYSALTRIGDIQYVLNGIEAARKENFEKIKINMVVMNDTKNEEITALKEFCSSKGLILQMINHYELKTEKQNAYTFDRPPKCALCNRIRLTADGFLKPCLHSNQEIPLNREDLHSSIEQAILDKPKNGMVCTNRSMIEIGG